jgi:hypothetical protein
MRWWQKVSTIALAPLGVVFIATQEYSWAIVMAGVLVLEAGKWINQPAVEVPRKANVPGVLFEAAGMALIVYGMWRVAMT